MPLLLTKIEGKGNGIKTVVPNMSDVAKALSRPATCEYYESSMDWSASLQRFQKRFLAASLKCG